MITQEVDLAIIGAGPAGMAAALSARKAGMAKRQGPTLPGLLPAN